MDKILQEIKRLITKYYPKDRTLNGNEFERGRQSICIELADIFDPINNKNSEPEFVFEPGQVIYKRKVVAKQMAGWHNVVTAFAGNGISVSTDMPYDNQLEGQTFEIIIRKAVDKKNQDEPQDFEEELKPIDNAPKPKKRRKLENIAVADGIYAQMQAEYEQAQAAQNNEHAQRDIEFYWNIVNAQARQ